MVATYNRLDQLRQVIDSIVEGTQTAHELIVIDGGSTDGTIEYIQNDPRVTPVLQGALLGTARCYNRVWRHVESRYSCWLSDDTEVVHGSLDAAVRILEAHPAIGMVGLKMKDTKGPGRDEAYRGGISEYGVLNCNHGVLRTSIARDVGFFNEGYRSYMIDPDLTASVLCAGHRVVMTRDVAVLHHREWAEREGPEIDAKVARDLGGIDNAGIYQEKFAFLAPTRTWPARLRARLVHYVARVLFLGASPDGRRLWLNRRDWVNLAGGRFISILDPILHLGLPYHLAQAIPERRLASPGNPVKRAPRHADPFDRAATADTPGHGPRLTEAVLPIVNTRSRNLVILMGTLNRLSQLRRVIESIVNGTQLSFELIVIDAGSTDGTIEFLQSHPAVTPVLQGARIGHARSHNEVWRHVDSRYSCWLSDDTEIVPGSLDLAVSILESDDTIGMVGLKMKDTMGSGRHEAYRGGLSEYGVLNCNHGVMPTALLRSVGFFNQSYRMYTIDPDLTASILSTGHRVVMTKAISVLHHRAWAEGDDDAEKVRRDMGGIDNWAIYRRKFAFLAASNTLWTRLRARGVHYVARFLFLGARPGAKRLWLNRRDWVNLAGGRFISLFDPLIHIARPYHLAQSVPPALLASGDNPYRHLVDLAAPGALCLER